VPRRTEILDLAGGLEDIDLIANERSVVLLTETGYLKRMPVSEFEATSRGTRGKAGTRSQGEEAVKLFIGCNDHDTLLLFSDRGVAYALPAYRVPQCSRTGQRHTGGAAVANPPRGSDHLAIGRLGVQRRHRFVDAHPGWLHQAHASFGV
jgi:DNA gyrase/topoisomerase IV subunit A